MKKQDNEVVKIKQTFISILLCLTLTFFIIGCAREQDQQQPTEKETQTILIKDFTYSPSTLTVKAGTTVIWENEDSVTHDVMNNAKDNFEKGEIFDFDLEPGESNSFVFNEPGEYEYHCDIHPSMKGAVIVE